MNLLPKSHQDFSQKDYWNSFFSKRGKQAFEWYGEYPELCGHLHKYVKPKDEILVIGCGNSKLSTDLYDVGYRHITNIDISQVVIRQMAEANSRDRPAMKYLHMDALHMSFADASFSVVLDKGTLDALMPDGSAETVQRIVRYFGEIDRVMKPGGRYVCVSLLQEHIVHALLAYFPAANWMFRVVRCEEAEQAAAAGGGATMAVFVVVCIKVHAPLAMTVLETCMAGDRMHRAKSTDEIAAAVKNVQQAALVCAGLARSSLADRGHQEDEVSFELFEPGNDRARFTIYVLDGLCERKNGRYAAFIVPQGRETEWLFSTRPGRRKLLKSAHFNRLAIVTMHRGHEYRDLESVKAELNKPVRQLAPANLTDTIPFLSLGEDVGHRTVRYEGHSAISGPFIVEDSSGDSGTTFRRLIFLRNQNVVQSEAKLKSVKRRGAKSRKLVVDAGYLACQHHAYMCVGVELAMHRAKAHAPNSLAVNGRVVVIGLGGGGLCTFLSHIRPGLSITAVDIDPAMRQIATEYFGLPCTDNLRVSIEDGLQFLENEVKAGSQYDAILFDVDSKDPTLGMSCPPKEFLEPAVLQNVRHSLRPDGIFVLNLVLRDETLHRSILSTLQSNFPSVCSFKLEEDLNEVFFCSKTHTAPCADDVKTAVEQLNGRRLGCDDVVETDSVMECLKVYTPEHT